MYECPTYRVVGGVGNRHCQSGAKPNADLRTREYLTDAEVERLLKATKGNRWAHRDAAMILVAYRHGLRAGELTDLQWDSMLSGRRLPITREKRS